jgi:hypothetical protein
MSATLEGTYESTVNSPLGKQDLVFDYHVDGSVLTGTISGEGNVSEVVDGEVTEDGFKHRCALKTPMGNTIVTVTGQQDGDGIKGTVKLPVGQLEFIATRIE